MTGLRDEVAMAIKDIGPDRYDFENKAIAEAAIAIVIERIRYTDLVDTGIGSRRYAMKSTVEQIIRNLAPETTP